MIRALLLACAALPVGTAAPAQEATAPAPVTRMDHISVVSIGRGEPVIFIPGLATPRAVWDGVAKNLAARHRVHLVQVNGFAGDDPRANLKPGVLDGVVADLAALIARGKMARPAVVGHSMGGLIGMKLASRHPASVGRLMVVDTLPFFGAIMTPGATPESIRPMAERIRASTAAGYEAARAAADTPVTSDPGGIWSNTPAGRIQVARWSKKADARVVAQAIYETMTTDATADLPRIAARAFTVLYATGAGPAVEPIWRRAYAGTSATLRPIPDSWHFIMLDQPAAFRAALDEFLAAPAR